MSLLSAIYAEGGDALQSFFDIEITGMPAPVFNDYQVADPTWDGKGDKVKEKGYTGVPENKAIIRAKTITIPTYGVKTSDINFYTTQIRVPVAKMEFTPEFTITFRVDQQWAIYQALMRWRSTVFDPESGYTKFDSTNPLFIGINRTLRGKPILKDMSFVGRCEAITVIVRQPKVAHQGIAETYKGSGKDTGLYLSKSHDKVYQTEDIIRRWRFQGAYPTKVEGVTFDYSSTSAQEVTVTFAYLDMIEYYEKDNLNDFE